MARPGGGTLWCKTYSLTLSYKFKTRYLDDSLFNAYPYWIADYYVDSVRYEGKWHFPGSTLISEVCPVFITM